MFSTFRKNAVIMGLIDSSIIKKVHPYFAKRWGKDEPMPVKEWIQKYRGKIRFEIILEISLNEDFFSENNIRKYGIYCVKEALNHVNDLNVNLLNVYNIAKKYSYGEATENELLIARSIISDNRDIKSGVLLINGDEITMAICAISHTNVSFTKQAVIYARDYICCNRKVSYSITNEFIDYLIENIEPL